MYESWFTASYFSRKRVSSSSRLSHYYTSNLLTNSEILYSGASKNEWKFFFLHRPYLPKDNSNFTNFFTFSSVTNQSLHLHKNERTAITLKYQFTMDKISSKNGKLKKSQFFFSIVKLRFFYF